jgi:hypothetical protein
MYKRDQAPLRCCGEKGAGVLGSRPKVESGKCRLIGLRSEMFVRNRPTGGDIASDIVSTFGGSSFSMNMRELAIKSLEIDLYMRIHMRTIIVVIKAYFLISYECLTA